MTISTIDRVAALHALADHIGQHDLAGDIISLSFHDFRCPGLVLHVQDSATVAAWVGSLGPVKAFGKWVGAGVHVWITGELAGAPLAVLYVSTGSKDRALRSEFRESVPDEDPGDELGWPIELPVALGGAA